MLTVQKRLWLALGLIIVVAVGGMLAWRSRSKTLAPDNSSSSASLGLQQRSGGPVGQARLTSLGAGEPVGRAPTQATEAGGQNAVAKGIDKSVAGRLFDVSESVKQACKTDTIECPLVMQSITSMIKEPRDLQWAAAMEETIQAAVDARGSDKYVTRNLECRTSICILEVEVHVPGGFNGRYDKSVTTRLTPNAAAISVAEYDSSGARFYVEVMDFHRR